MAKALVTILALALLVLLVFCFACVIASVMAWQETPDNDKDND